MFVLERLSFVCVLQGKLDRFCFTDTPMDPNCRCCCFTRCCCLGRCDEMTVHIRVAFFFSWRIERRERERKRNKRSVKRNTRHTAQQWQSVVRCVLAKVCYQLQFLLFFFFSCSPFAKEREREREREATATTGLTGRVEGVFDVLESVDQKVTTRLQQGW